MSDKIFIQCPGCSAKFAISDESKLGKKIRCSKCSEVFVAKSSGSKSGAPTKASKPKAPKSDDDEFNFDDMESEAEEESRPVKAKSGTTKKGGKGKGKKSAGNLPLIIGGSVAVLILIGVGVYVFGGKENAPQQAPASPPVAQQAPTTIAPGVTAPAGSAQVLPTAAGSPASANAGTAAPANATQTAWARQKRETSAAEMGETGEVVAANLSELPAGTKKLTVKTRWGGRDNEKGESKQVDVVNLILDLQADFLQKACAFGHADLTTIQVTADRSLSLHHTHSTRWDNPLVYYVPYQFHASAWTSPGNVDRAGAYWPDHPPGTLRIGIPIIAPDDAISEMSLIEGQFKIKIGNKVEEVVLSDLRAAANQPLIDAALTAAEATLSLNSENSPFGMREVVRFSIGQNYAIGPLFVFGEVNFNLAPSMQIELNEHHFSSEGIQKLPGGQLKLPIHLYSQIEEITVPFRFEKVPLPSPDKRPTQ